MNNNYYNIKAEAQEDMSTSQIRSDVFKFMRTNWLPKTEHVNFDRIFDLLKEQADVLVITFTLQHIRLKILKLEENWEMDCAAASHILQAFEKTIQEDKERKNKEIEESTKIMMEKMKKIMSSLEIGKKDSKNFGFSPLDPLPGGDFFYQDYFYPITTKYKLKDEIKQISEKILQKSLKEKK